MKPELSKWLTLGPKRRAQSSAEARRRDGGNENGSGGRSARLSIATRALCDAGMQRTGLTDCRPTSGRTVDGHYEVKVSGASASPWPTACFDLFALPAG